MGIHCEINILKTAGETFKPGSVVSGIIKYAVEEETKINKITVSLKGSGTLVVEDSRPVSNGRTSNVETVTCVSKEEYVDINDIVTNPGEVLTLPIGSYQIHFNFILPDNIPPTFKCKTSGLMCNITYNIHIKFERPGFLKFAKLFRKEITVGSSITPRLPMEPTTYGEHKTLTHVLHLCSCSKKKSMVYLKATISNSVIKPGGRVQFNYNVINESSVTIKGIKVKVLESHQFTLSNGGRQIPISDDVDGTDSKSNPIKSGDIQNMTIEIPLPSNRISLDHSNLVSRDYFVCLLVHLPIPHRNFELKIPIQIGDQYQNEETEFAREAYDIEAPPSYWEAMCEENVKNDANK